MYADSDDELDDYEYPDEEDDLEFDDPDAYLIHCPNCDKELFDDAEFCPSCGEYILVDNAPSSAWKLTSVVVLVAIIAAIIVGAVF